MESDRGIDQRRSHPTRNGSGHRSRNGHSHLPAFAALDLGTNNCRLLVARPSGSGFTVIDSFSRIIRLGEGINETGRLSEPAIERAINALRVCVSKLRRWRVRYGRYVATEACRKASNCGEFLDRAAYEADVRLEIIDAGEEAALAARGCGPLLTAKRENAVVFDIGGGSTEVIWLATPPGGPNHLSRQHFDPHGRCHHGGSVARPGNYARTLRQPEKRRPDAARRVRRQARYIAAHSGGTRANAWCIWNRHHSGRHS